MHSVRKSLSAIFCYVSYAEQFDKYFRTSNLKYVTHERVVFYSESLMLCTNQFQWQFDKSVIFFCEVSVNVVKKGLM